MDNNSSRNNTIAKNTFLLYLRSLFGLAVSLYTSRIVLNSLGIDDYGIYNVVGGMVAMFSLLSNSLSTAISRYLTFELGKENIDKLRTIFFFLSSHTDRIGIIYSPLSGDFWYMFFESLYQHSSRKIRSSTLGSSVFCYYFCCWIDKHTL